MNFILDLIVILIVAVFVILSAKKGFVRSVIEVAGVVLAIVLAFSLSTPVANFVYDKGIEPSIVKTVTEVASDNLQNKVDEINDKLPVFITENAERFGISLDTALNNANEEASVSVQEYALSVSQKAVKPVAVKIIGMIASTAIFVILLLLVKLISKPINRLFSFSVVGKLNRTLGGIIGLVKGIVVAIIFCIIVNLIVSFTENGFLIFTKSAVENSTVFKFLLTISPF